ncbi:hypothetical protein NGM37_45670, partial [Streptomyces sp. TRM76130]|nr:hypothetical protein [Streptomyces sp. TRM76130]
ICVARTPGAGESSSSSTRVPTDDAGISGPDLPRTAGVTIAPAGAAHDVGPALQKAQSLLRTVQFR